MRILECPILKNRIALGCIGLLGLSTCSGLIHTSVSSGFSKTLSGLFSGFSSSGSQESQESQPQQQANGKISPIQFVSQIGEQAWNDYLTPFVKTTYKWIEEKGKREAVWGVLKKFWDYKFFKGLMSSLPWIIWNWVYIFSHSEIRSKFLLAWKHSLYFFDAVVKTSNLKEHSSHFWKIFAELLFVPSRAITNFVKRQAMRRQGQPCSDSNVGRGDSVSQAGTTICISVTREGRERK